MIGPIYCLTVPLLLGAVQTEMPSDWKEAKSEPGRFTVMMPGMTSDKMQTVKTATGSLKVHLLIGEGKNEALFVVSYCDFPDAELKKGPVDKRLDQARDGAVESARGKLKSEKVIKLAGHPGRDLVIESEKGEIVARTRIFLVKNRLYQVMVLGDASAKEATMFLDSFRLNK